MSGVCPVVSRYASREAPIDTETAEAVVSDMVSFLRAGGVFAWSDWCSASPEARGLMETAGTLHRRMVARELAGAFFTATGADEIEASTPDAITDVLAHRAVGGAA